jgi:serine protease Do
MLTIRNFGGWVLLLACTLQLARAEEATNVVRGNLLAPKAFRAAAAKIRPSVVTIETFGGLSSGASKTFKPGEGPTTGVILSADGYIVTSTFNFLSKPPVITVIFADNKRRVAKLMGRDETRKICLLKVDDVTDLPVPEMVKRSEIQVGQWAVALGVGFGDSEPSLSAGIISATSRISGKAVQTDANLSPANYGGPLLDLEGRMLGVCVPLSPGSNDTAAGAEWYDSGIGFAVPLVEIDSIIAAMKEGKTLRRGYLGIQAAPYGEPPSGVMVKAVTPGFSAEKAGLKAEDKILRLAGDAVLDVTHLGVLVNKHLFGDTIQVDLQRGEEKLTLNVTLGEMPPPPKPPMVPKVEPAAKPKNPEQPESPPQPEQPKKPEEAK